MSFRYYLGKVSKNKREKIKALSETQLMKMLKEDCVRPYMIAKEVYGLGSELDVRKLRDNTKKFYTNSKTHNSLSTGEDEFCILTKEGFLDLINLYHAEIHEFLKKQEVRVEKLDKGELDPYETEQLKMAMKFKTQEWADKDKMQYTPYDLTEKETLISSWKYEYAIFELVRIYKDFDFEKNYLILYGY